MKILKTPMNKYLITTAVLLASMSATAQTVSTVAGSQYQGGGLYNATPNNALADEKYSNPAGIAIDQNGKIYITDEHNVMLIDGNTSRIRAGYLGDPNEPGAIGDDNATGTVSRFFSPFGIAVHPSTNDAYICDRYNGIIRKVGKFVNASNGQAVTTYAGKTTFVGGHKDGTLGVAEFNEPVDAVFDANGNLYVSDFANDCIRKITSTHVSTLCGSPGNEGSANGTGSAARFYAPSGICLETSNTILVADKNNNAIRRVNISTGEVTTVVNSGITSPNDVVVVGSSIFIIENTCIKVYNGSTVSLFCGHATAEGYVNATGSAARFRRLEHAVFDAVTNTLLVVDQGNNVIRSVTMNPAPTVNFTASTTSPTIGQTVILTDVSQFGESSSWTITPASYTLQNGSTLTDKIVYLTFGTAGSYNVSLTASNTFGSNSTTRNNYINVSNISGVAPGANFSATKTTAALNEEITLIDQSSNNPNSWTWSITPTNFTWSAGSDANTRFPKVKFTAEGTYTVSLTASNAVGPNTANKTNYITISASASVRAHNPIHLQAYPNPVRDQFNLNITGVRGNARVEMLGIDGRSIHSWNALGNGSQLLSIPAGTAAGLYIIQVSDGHFVQQLKIRIEG
jgi:PKD repeat protein